MSKREKYHLDRKTKVHFFQAVNEFEPKPGARDNDEYEELMLDPRFRLTYSWLDSVREIISRSFRIYSILLSKSLFSNLSKIIFFEMALKRCLLP